MEIAGRKIAGVSHIGVHGDEIGCFIVLYLAGRFFDRIHEFLDVYASDDAIYFGVRHGPFDEHPSPHASKEEEEKKRDACALTLLVDAFKEFGFDVIALPTMKNIVDHLLKMDSRAKADERDITKVIKEIHRYCRNRDEESYAIEWALRGLLAKFHEDLTAPTSKPENFTIDYIADLIKKLPDVFPEFDTGQQWYDKGWVAHEYSHKTLYQEATREYKQKIATTMKGWIDIEKHFNDYAPVEGFRMVRKVRREKMGDVFVPIVFIQSDNPQIGRFARSKEARKLGINAGILVQRNSEKKYFINFDNKIEDNGFQRYPVAGDFIVALLRNACRAKDETLKPLPLNDKQLYAAGESADAPIFYFKKDTESILNGSETHPYTEPLPLTPAETMLCVVRGVRERRRR